MEFCIGCPLWFSGILMRIGITLVFIFTHKISGFFSAGGLLVAGDNESSDNHKVL
jgi:hypothetical protein